MGVSALTGTEIFVGPELKPSRAIVTPFELDASGEFVSYLQQHRTKKGAWLDYEPGIFHLPCDYESPDKMVCAVVELICRLSVSRISGSENTKNGLLTLSPEGNVLTVIRRGTQPHAQ